VYDPTSKTINFLNTDAITSENLKEEVQDAYPPGGND
jgi:hypothetical protein